MKTGAMSERGVNRSLSLALFLLLSVFFNLESQLLSCSVNVGGDNPVWPKSFVVMVAQVYGHIWLFFFLHFICRFAMLI